MAISDRQLRASAVINTYWQMTPNPKQKVLLYLLLNTFITDFLFYCLCLVEFPVLVKLPIHICCSSCLSQHFICYCTHCLTCSILIHFADAQLCIYIPIANATLVYNALS